GDCFDADAFAAAAEDPSPAILPQTPLSPMDARGKTVQEGRIHCCKVFAKPDLERLKRNLVVMGLEGRGEESV
ncbi:MAG: hypothetical protein Q9222_007915, partial [Ikaeria aurantiellina]